MVADHAGAPCLGRLESGCPQGGALVLPSMLCSGALAAASVALPPVWMEPPEIFFMEHPEGVVLSALVYQLV